MPWPTSPRAAAHRAVYADAEFGSFWHRRPHEPAAALSGSTDAGLCIVTALGGHPVHAQRLAAADTNDGRRGLWLRLLDRLGLGFDSKGGQAPKGFL